MVNPISVTSLRRVEGKLFGPVPRRGQRHIRVFTAEQVETLRAAERATTELGAKPTLLTLAEVAERAGCCQ